MCSPFRIRPVFLADKDEAGLRIDAWHQPYLEHPALVNLLNEALWFTVAPVGCQVTERTDNWECYAGQTCLAGAHRCASSLTFTCFPVAVSLQGYAGARKAYVIARGVQPLVICDGTTLSEL